MPVRETLDHMLRHSGAVLAVAHGNPGRDRITTAKDSVDTARLQAAAAVGGLRFLARVVLSCSTW
jgi:DNA repair protein RadC